MGCPCACRGKPGKGRGPVRSPRLGRARRLRRAGLRVWTGVPPLGALGRDGLRRRASSGARRGHRPERPREPRRRRSGASRARSPARGTSSSWRIGSPRAVGVPRGQRRGPRASGDTPPERCRRSRPRRSRGLRRPRSAGATRDAPRDARGPSPDEEKRRDPRARPASCGKPRPARRRRFSRRIPPRRGPRGGDLGAHRENSRAGRSLARRRRACRSRLRSRRAGARGRSVLGDGGHRAAVLRVGSRRRRLRASRLREPRSARGLRHPAPGGRLREGRDHPRAVSGRLPCHEVARRRGRAGAKALLLFTRSGAISGS